MSILIKGMEMPASCLSCPHNEHGTIHEWELYCGLTGDYIGHWDDKSLNNGHRPDTCPLVEVPTPHGRLIDADELMLEFADFVRASNNSDFAAVPRWNDAVSLLESAPTIIEAEEGEKE